MTTLWTRVLGKTGDGRRGWGAGEAYAWATENPDKVSCIYAENPLLRSKMSKTPPLEGFTRLAKAGVPRSFTSAAAWIPGWRRRR